MRACRRAGSRQTTTPSMRRSLRMAPASCSSRMRATWSPATPTAPPTCSCAGWTTARRPASTSVAAACRATARPYVNVGTRCPAGISSNGRYVVFSTTATNFTATDVNGSQRSSFVRDTVSGTTTLVDTDQNGEQHSTGSSECPQISPDGRYISFVTSTPQILPDNTTGGRSSCAPTRCRRSYRGHPRASRVPQPRP